MRLDLATIRAHARPLALFDEGGLLLGRSDVTIAAIDEGGSLALVGLGWRLLLASGRHDQLLIKRNIISS